MGSNLDLRDQVNNPQIKNTVGELFSGKKGYKIKDDVVIKPCKTCKKQVKSTEKFCSECGTPVQEEDVKKNCPNCKKLLKGTEKFCIDCGAKI